MNDTPESQDPWVGAIMLASFLATDLNFRAIAEHHGLDEPQLAAETTRPWHEGSSDEIHAAFTKLEESLDRLRAVIFQVAELEDTYLGGPTLQ